MYTLTLSGEIGGRCVPTITCEEVEQAASHNAPRKSALRRVRGSMVFSFR
jgi:hypothetical protein